MAIINDWAGVDRRQLIDAALGKRPADLVILGGRLVNVYTREIYEADVGVVGNRIATVGTLPPGSVGERTQVIDAKGHYLVPGFIDQHSHTYESHLTPGAYARAVIPHGTTVQCTDFYGEAVVGGVRAVRLSLDLARLVPLKYLFVLPLPAFYQNGELGHTGQPTFPEMESMLEWAECHGINDTFAARVVGKEEALLQLIEKAQRLGKHVCGHASEIDGPQLQAWVAFVRNSDDHESVSPHEAVAKARLGVWISMREGSGCYNVRELVKAVTEHGVDPRRFTFSTDLLSPLELYENGHIDNAARVAIRAGLNPLVAIQMATLNAAECLGIADDHGAIAPGKVADVLLVKDLAQLDVRSVIASGELIVRDGALTRDIPIGDYPEWSRRTVRLGGIGEEDLAVRASVRNGAVSVRVIHVRGDSLITEETIERLEVRDGVILPDPERDVLKLVSIERHKGSRQVGRAFVRGFGLKRGAIATTYNPQHQDLVIAGTSDRDILAAAQAIEQMSGGLAVVDEGRVLSSLPLPLFGLLSDQPLEFVVQRLREVYAAARSLGCALPAPFHTLAFVGLPVDIGKLKISHRGLVDVWERRIVGVEV